VFQFKIASSVAASLFVCLVFGVAQTGSPNAPGSALPPWLAPVPGARDVQSGGDAEIVSSYRVSRSPADIAAYYREQFQKAAIHSNVSFDGIGTVIRCSEGKEYCVIQIREADGDASVKVSYSPSAGSAVVAVAPRDPTNEAPKPAATSAPPKAEPPGSHQIEYVIEGSAGAAGLTYRNAGGGTEQKDVALPAHINFRTAAGAFAYISAQKKGAGGTVRVEIIVDGITMRQSTSSAPFGIATASGKIVDRKIIY
jgi:hypothetical protein